jgi:trans-AT polyketide synthase/acyltransferase/oxidoreductase domain-containing protein
VGRRQIAPEQLGDTSFLRDHGVRMAYVAGSMYKGIASKELVVRMGKSRLLSFLGTGGMTVQQVHDDILDIKSKLGSGEPFGVNLLHNMFKPQHEEDLVDLYLRHAVRHIEASSYTTLTSAVVRYRVTGIRSENGRLVIPNKIMAKVSRPEIAEHFLSPAPRHIVDKLLAEGRITRGEAELSARIPMADDICAEGDSGGHTDRRVAYTLVPAFQRLERELRQRFGYANKVRIGSAGGLGTPQAIAAAFTLGADFVMTGSINQCSPQAGTSDLVKDMLAQCNVQDTDMAPAGDMFEIGAKIQVLKRGTLFPARANKLYELYRNHGSWEEIDEKVRQQIEHTCFARPYAEVWAETRDYYRKHLADELARLERDPRARMAAVFRWYFVHTGRLARDGRSEDKANFQIHTGPAVGAFNQWAKGTRFEDWRNRNVDEIATELMAQTGAQLFELFQRFVPATDPIDQQEAEHV